MRILWKTRVKNLNALREAVKDTPYELNVINNIPNNKLPREINRYPVFALVSLFEAEGVDLVFSGHDHDYERSVYNGIVYVVTGGGGAELRKQKMSGPDSKIFIMKNHFCNLKIVDGKLKAIVYDRNLNIIDEFRL